MKNLLSRANTFSIRKILFKRKLKSLGDFWEKIYFPNGITVGASHDKSLLWKNMLSSYIRPEQLFEKSVLDIGCNAGGNLIELAKYKPSTLVGIDHKEIYTRQTAFVLKQCGVDARVMRTSISHEKVAKDYAQELGRFDVVFCLGVIYHLSTRKTVVELLKYLHQNANLVIVSNQLINPSGFSKAAKQRKYDHWSPSTRAGVLDVVKEAGYSRCKDIYYKPHIKTWPQHLTNNWYFELLK